MVKDVFLGGKGQKPRQRDLLLRLSVPPVRRRAGGITLVSWGEALENTYVLEAAANRTGSYYLYS